MTWFRLLLVIVVVGIFVNIGFLIAGFITHHVSWLDWVTLFSIILAVWVISNIDIRRWW